MRTAGPYPDRMDTIPMAWGTNGVSTEGLDAPLSVDAAVMAVEDHS